MSPQVDTPTMHADSDTIEYRAVSGLAIVALVLGALSASALVGPLLWFVPVVAIVAALVAMRKIRRSSGELVGWNIAFLGLLLAILFGAAAPARTISRQYWLAHRAEQFARQFFDFLERNQPHAAHQLRERPGIRKPLSSALPEAYQDDPESQESFEQFIGQEPAKTLLEQGSRATVVRLETEVLGHDGRGDNFGLRYRVTPQSDSNRKAFDVVLAVRRSLDSGTQRETWQIDGINVE